MRVAALFVLGVVWLIVTPPLARAQTGACASEGVTVVVDFADLGGGVVVGCAPSPESGLDALTHAGFSYVQVQSDAAFICRINDLPDPSAEDCADTPPANAYWSYWTASTGGSWRYSVSGATFPVSSDYQGWVFSDGTAAAPRFDIPPGPATTTTTAPTTTTTTTTTTSTTTTTTTSTTTTTTVATTSKTPTTNDATTTTTESIPTTSVPVSTTSPVSPTTTALPTSTDSAVVATVSANPASAADGGSASGGAGGVIVTLVAVAALGGAAVVVARRRTGDG